MQHAIVDRIEFAMSIITIIGAPARTDRFRSASA
jgi:hypothetical protein